jgi:methionine synthase II (cobalamin-independent)
MYSAAAAIGQTILMFYPLRGTGGFKKIVFTDFIFFISCVTFIFICVVISMDFKPNAATTVIGSFPHLVPSDACRLVFDVLPEIPAWPQLPRRDFLEDMNAQFSMRLPCIHADLANKKIGFDTSRDLAGELERFYTHILEDDVEYFGLDDAHAAGFGCFIEALRANRPAGVLALKGQTTGPLTLGLMTDSTDGKYALYKPDLFDSIVKSCAMNARWQVRRMKEFSDLVVVSFDEPSLSIIGSGFYSVDKSLVSGSFKEIIQAIHAEGGLAATHCCGNADWDELLDPSLDLDLINFDATDDIIADKFINARNAVGFLERGRCIAWGVVPTIKDKIENATPEGVEQNFHAVIKKLSRRGVSESEILARSIITPSCGTGTLPLPLAEKTMVLLKGLSLQLKGSFA